MRLGWFPGGSLIRRYHPEPVLDRLAALDITRQTKLLDIGCGRGTYLYLLRELGVEARGVDPYISEDVSDAFGVRVHRCRLEDMAGEWDIIRMHHSLEHVPDQVGTLRTIRGKLARNGIAVISLPVIGWAWSRYGVNWVGLDAPRHLFLHTKRSLQLVAERAGLTLVGMTYDSTEQQLWASELYSRDIPMRPNGSSQFTTEQLENYRLRAGELNRQEQGDQATFMFARD
jgi:SAM-dependent methyltransferase